MHAFSFNSHFAAGQVVKYNLVSLNLEEKLYLQMTKHELPIIYYMNHMVV